MIDPEADLSSFLTSLTFVREGCEALLFPEISGKPNGRSVISVIGAGGKTTLIKRLAASHAAQNNTVLIVPSTRMYRESDTLTACLPADSSDPQYCVSNDPLLFAEAVEERIRQKRVCMAGAFCRKDPAKIQALPESYFMKLLPLADLLLIEADGSRHYPLKYPNSAEPVIYPQTDEILLVMGLDGLGQAAKNSIFRCSLAEAAGLVQEDTPVTVCTVKDLIQKGYLEMLSRTYKTIPVRLVFSLRDSGNKLRYSVLDPGCL